MDATSGYQSTSATCLFLLYTKRRANNYTVVLNHCLTATFLD